MAETVVLRNEADDTSDDIESDSECIHPKYLVDFLNEKFGEDIDTLDRTEEFLAEYKAKEEFLANALKESEKQTSEGLVELISSCQLMLNEIECISLKIEESINRHALHKEKTSEMHTHLKGLTKDVDDIENERMYLMWVTDISTLSEEIENHIQKKNIVSGIETYDKLHLLCSTLQSSTCGNLKRFSSEICHALCKKLKETLSRELNTLLSSMKYPFSTGISSPVFNKKEDTEEQFRKTIISLIKLKPLCEENKRQFVTELLTEPLKKRFMFHFYGERHTNNPEKPEWYYTQVVNWIRDHGSFFDDYVQPVIQEHSTVNFNLKMEFCKMLVDLLEEKVQDTIETVIANDVMLAHLIDETLVFEKELHTCVSELDPSVGCLHILLKEEFFKRWLDLEEKFTFEKINMMLEDDGAWEPKFSEIIAADKNLIYFVPACVEEMMTFLSLLTSRHKSLHNIEAQREFLQILIRSMHHFTTRMKDLASVEVMRPHSQCYCSIVNGSFYMFQVLEEWSDDLYFVQISRPALSEDAVEEEADIVNVFGDILVSLDRFINSLVESIVEYLEIGLKENLKSYKAERWHALPSLKDYAQPILSNGACDMMLFIKEHLHLLEKKLCVDVFDKVWKQTANMIDHQIFIEVVYESHFNEGGAAQMQYDLRRNLFVLFGQYTGRAESYFRLLKDSCILLNLLPGSAFLIKEVFAHSQSKKDMAEQVKHSLEEIGVKCLNASQANRLINSRVDWPKV